jgi:hypothetical protein
MSGFALFKEYHNDNSSFENEALKSNISSNQLTDVYFSHKNIEALHEGIRYQVYVRSENKHIIDRQSDIDLKIVMRSIYYEYSKNLPYDILGQVRDLNAKVIDYCVNNILSEINMYLRYRQDISSNPEPLPRSVNVSSAGSKTLFMKDF